MVESIFPGEISQMIKKKGGEGKIIKHTYTAIESYST